MSSLSVPATCALILYSCAVLLPLAASRENNYTLKEFQEGRIFSWSADAPMTRELARLQPVVDGAALILTHFRRVENSLMASINTGKAAGPDDDIQPCNYKEKAFGNAARNRAGVRGWPAPDVSCISDVYGADLNSGNVPQRREPPYDLDDLYEAFFNRGKAMKENVKSITRKIFGEDIVDNFTNPDVLWNCQYDTPSQRCVLHPSSGLRIGDNWYLAHAITNEPKNANLPLLGRQGFTEFPRFVNGTLGDNLLMCLPRRPDTGENHEIWTNTTTLISSFRGTAGQSSIDGNPAILRSLEKSDLFVQQAEDALTASNIAILVLPLGLNLVPIALIADVSTITMLMYTLMSDVLTVIPLGIKGTELITIGSQRHRSVLVRMTGATNGTRPEAAVAQMFAAECRAHAEVLPIGVSFLVLSIAFLIGGIAGEFVARSYAMKQKEQRLAELKEADLMLSSEGNSEPASAGSRESSQPPSLTLIGFQPRGTVGSPFRHGSFNESYKERKGAKNA